MFVLDQELYCLERAAHGTGMVDALPLAVHSSYPYSGTGVDRDRSIVHLKDHARLLDHLKKAGLNRYAPLFEHPLNMIDGLLLSHKNTGRGTLTSPG
jgi:hypothetical protein